MSARKSSSALADRTAALDCELYLPSLEVARLSWGGREFEGKPRLDPEVALDLMTLEALPTEYGRVLYDAICPLDSRLRSGLKEAVAEARRTQRRLRLRLHLSSELPHWVHSLYWELLADREHRLAFGRSPETAFSRYGGMAQPLGEVIDGRPRLLVVISAPSDVESYQMANIDAASVKARIAALAAEVADEIEVEFLEPPATLERLRHRLGSYQFLHLFGHGLVAKTSGPNDEAESALLLEDDDGMGRPVSEELLTELFLGERELRLITLIACHGGAPSSNDRWSGLAGRLVERGTPAVVAMRRAVSLDDAHRFTQHLYLQLVKTRRIDLAVNEARQQLFLREPDGIDWSSPILYQRLEGDLWRPEDVELNHASLGTPLDHPLFPRVAFSARRLRKPQAWVPAFVWLIFAASRFVPSSRVTIELDVVATRVAFRLAENASLLGDLSLREIAASRLATLRTPEETGRTHFASEGESVGFLLAAQDASSRLSLAAPPFARGARIAFESQGDRLYRLSIADSEQPLRATFRGAVGLKRLDRPRENLTFASGESILLEPNRGALEIDLEFAQIDGEELSRALAIDRLELLDIEERVTSTVTEFRKVSSIERGEVRVPATRERWLLDEHSRAEFVSATGSIQGLELTDGSLRFSFRGAAEGASIHSAGRGATRLSASVLDGWLPRSRQNDVAMGSGAVALVLALVTMLRLRPIEGSGVIRTSLARSR